ncbi:cupin domain-containing protein [Parvibium lacunae]|uniref:ChrR-like cupin domain-containing protein n=1 Tax=Parvibium lacunae TaxID=1888893 RepID=A0A368KZV9_9BURK|nr:cupin domain-containing protein [Parvibium lacunae]RCS56838.1 hypothetical protein DU000_10885 [Parvibium lacunae]
MDTLLTLNLDQGEWHTWGPGVEGKLLAEENGAESCLIWMQPGASWPSHPHPAEEETLVIQGELIADGVVLKAGDFHLAQAGSAHGELLAPHGALFFIRYAVSRDHYHFDAVSAIAP